MKLIYRIAKAELRMLFCSPVAWFLLVIFTLQTALFFTGRYEWFMKGNEYGSGRTMMTSMSLFANGIWGIVQNYLYYYIPLLTMGLISRELSSGSIKLLYSSPVRNSQIILGKFLSMVIYAALMCGILLLYVIYAAFTVENFELPVVLVGLLGLFLLTCTYVAVGIFVSSLTSYQFVAAIGTFIILMLLSMVGGWWQEYDIIRDVTYWLSINGRASTFVMGMLCSEDVLYFPIVTALFLFLTVIRLNAVRQKVRWQVSFGRYVAVVLIACTLGYFSSRPKLMGYYDASSTKWNTLTPHSQDIVSKLDGGLTITAYVNILGPNYQMFAFPKFIQQNREHFKLYERFKPEMKLKVVYYYDTITPADGIYGETFAQRLGSKNQTVRQAAKKMCELFQLDSVHRVLSPEKVRELTNLEGEKTFAWELVRESGERAWLRTYDDPMNPFPTEAEISAAMKRMTLEVPKIGFVEGYGMRSIHDTKTRGYYFFAYKKDFRQALVNQGFETVEINLEKGIPADVNILTIADMREPFTENEEQVLADYIARGGNLYVLGEPRRREVMNPLLNKYFGVELLEGTLVQYRLEWLQPDILNALITPAARELSYYFGLAYGVMLPTAAGLEKVADRGFKVTPVLVSDTLNIQRKENRSYAVWNEMESLDYVEEPLTINPAKGEVAKDYCAGMALTRMVNGKEQRIMILGDADCISNGEITEGRSQTNFIMDLGTFHWLSNNELPVDVRRPSTTDNRVDIGRYGFYVMNWGFKWIIPLLLAGAGIVLWIRRRSK